MNHFLRKFSTPYRIAAIAAAAGSAFLLSDGSRNSDYTASVSITAPLRESLQLPWQTGLLGPLFSVGTSSVPSSDIRKDISGVSPSEEAPKPCCGCLGRDSFARAAAKVGPAVVNISAPEGAYGITPGKSIGSGTIIDEDGTILTCAHTVVDFYGLRASSKGKVHITLQDGRTFEGTVVNADLQSDVAIVKINSKTPLPTAKLGSSRKLQPGDWVIAVGCPLSLQNTVTAGIGNSGGPLVNIDGEVIGVNIMKVYAADGLSFAFPIDSVTKIMEHFKKSGRVVRPWVGLKMVDLTEVIITQLKERDPTFPNVKKGILVPMVTPGSPAERAGFRPGDVVIEFDGNAVASIKEIIEIMGDRVGVPIGVVVIRARDDTVTLTVIPEESNSDM
ncbi:hypothetical protein C1H46_009284 [Malus baccata]|uniref:PDZ domain-containing protein n=1 Tax=Malus baccata TaxID=106549 RepID=A0A540N262_MALBA|nr:hypothetical protein C1H46_009284 [Malus baccata]